METCQNSFTEKSQSLTGVHIWFIDDDFNGGRRKGNVEVYAADRYIAMTGVRVLNSSEELKTLNGACNAVITKFIGSRGGNLFDTPARTNDDDRKINLEFKNAAPMTDADRELVDYFRSDKCRDRDANMFNLFSGNLAEYSKNTGKALDDSVADCDLFLKILYCIGGEGSDDSIVQRALNIFGQSELAKRDKWIGREDYRLRTISAAFDIWVKNGRNFAKRKFTALIAAQEAQDSPQAPLEYLNGENVVDAPKTPYSAQVDDEDKEFDALFAKWQAANRNEAINPDTISELKDAKSFFDSLTVETFTPDIPFDNGVRRKVALCDFYFPNFAQKFFDILNAAKKQASDNVKNAKSLKMAVDETDERIKNISVAKLKGDIQKITNQVKREHKDFLRKKHEDELNAKYKKFREQRNSTDVTLKDCPISLEIPYNVVLNEEGITIIDDTSPNRPKRQVAANSPIVPTKIFVNHDSEGTSYEVAIKTRGRWRRVVVDGDELFDSRKVLCLAKDGGALIYSPSPLCKYFACIIGKNQNVLPVSKIVSRCGWYNFGGKDYFIDPRRPCVIPNDGKNISVNVDLSRSEFAKHLKQVGNLDEWKRAYLLAKKSPVARLIVAAAVAPILLKILGERNFLLYIYAPTRAGKTTALHLGASAVGDEKIIRSFDATKNGLAGAAADVNDYVFCVDEKQVADNYLKDQFKELAYALGNGLGRTKLNKDSTLKKMQDWRTIAIMTGETLMLSDTVTDGANTRLLTIKAPKEILSAADCRVIRDIIKENHGLVLPLVIDKVVEIGRDALREMFKDMFNTFAKKFPDTLPEYQRYVSSLTLADGLLNCVLFGDTAKAPDGRPLKDREGRTLKASDDAIINAKRIFPLIPTIAEISATQREKDFVRGIIAKNQNNFDGGNVAPDHMKEFSGKLYDDDGFTYLTVQFLKEACKREGFDYHKLVSDLVADGFFIPSTKIPTGCKKPLDVVQKKIGKTNARCYRIRNAILNGEE